MQTANLKWVQDEIYIATTTSNHIIPIDNSKTKTAPGSMELVLAALVSCTATDVVLILQKKRQNLESLEVEAKGERAVDPPAVFTKIELTYRLRGKLDEKAVRDTIELSENKYCSVAAMLRKTTEITYRYEILPPKNQDAIDSVVPNPL
jgi:putative redox protein